jgi:nucleoside-diphosphate-sugar epimerase
LKNILVLGGTRYLGLEFINILNEGNFKLYVASRNKILTQNFIYIDRKNQDDLDNLFKRIQFDVVIDFINFSLSDSEKLLNSLRFQLNPPKLILISTTYIYDSPLQIGKDSLFDEDSFLPSKHKLFGLDRPDISYSNGKRDMESYSVNNYFNDKLVILRFPIILGANDYTQRTSFYSSLIKEGKSINPRNVLCKTNYILSFEAANAILNFVNEDLIGIYNVCFDPISEYDLISIICDFHHYKLNLFINEEIEITNTPFTNMFDFKIDSIKYQKLFPFKNSFVECFNRELLKINI